MKRIFSNKHYFLGLLILAFIGIFFTTELFSKQVNRLLPIYCVDTNGKKLVSITFDAAWGADDTDQIIEILQKYNVKATFFIVGDWARKYPVAVKKFADAGHDIANHSDKHPHVNAMSKEEIKRDIMSAHQEIKTLLGKDIDLYRPPYGEYNNTVIQAAKECNYHVIQWDVDSLDWKGYGVDQEINQVLKHKHLGNGSIILFHNDTKFTLDALPTIIEGLQSQGYTLVPISELIVRGDYKIDHEGRQISAEERGK